MSYTKFWELFQLLSPVQRKDLKIFVLMSSNHLSNREEEIVTKLLTLNAKNRLKPEELIIDEILEPNEKKNWNKYKNRFLNTFEDYLSLQWAKNNPSVKELSLLSLYHEMDLGKNFKGKQNKMDQILKDSKSMSHWRSLLRFQVLDIGLQRSARSRKKDETLSDMQDELEAFYIENRLRLLCEQVNRNNILNHSRQDLNIIDNLIGPDIGKLNKRSQCYYYLIQLLINNDMDALDRVDYILTELEDKEDGVFINTILSYKLNHHIQRLNSGFLEHARLYIYVINKKIERKLFVIDGHVSPGQFKNCVTIAILAGMTKWADNFIGQFGEFIPRDRENEVLTYCRGILLFEAQDYSTCHETIKDFKSSDVYFRIAFDKLLLKLLYYDLRREKYKLENYLALVDRLRKYIGIQRSLNEVKKTKNLKFIAVLKKLVRGKAIEVNKLIKMIPIVDWVWIKKEVAPRDNL